MEKALAVTFFGKQGAADGRRCLMCGGEAAVFQVGELPLCWGCELALEDAMPLLGKVRREEEERWNK